MRYSGFWLLLGIGVMSCSSDFTPTVYVGMAYQVRCLDCQPRALDDKARDIKAVDGEDGHQLACRVDDSTGTKRVTFSVVHESTDETKNYTVQISNGNVAGDESDGPCQVKVIEGANTYQGACGTDDPSMDRPCQVSFNVDKGVLKGTLYCANIQNEATANVTRYFVAPLLRSAASFEIYGCSGI